MTDNQLTIICGWLRGIFWLLVLIAMLLMFVAAATVGTALKGSL